MKIALFAPDGRMGRAIADAATDLDGVDVADNDPDVLIDFSAPEALEDSIAQARDLGCALLVGTTGLGDAHHRLIKQAAEERAVLLAPNTSIGVALLSDLVERAAALLGPADWDVEILEAHHKHKADAPSGTALHLGEAVARGRGSDPDEERGRDGTGLTRRKGAIGYAALRGGSVAGDHDVLFLGPDERLILSHRAESRAIFARGAITAARFLKGQAAGLYSMADVVA